MNLLSIAAIALITIIILYFLAIMPRICFKADRKPFVMEYYAHRGIHNNKSDAPENSLKAFKLAIDKGFGIELDVQHTKDGILVVFHDYTLNRVCKIDKKVKELTYEELNKLHLYHSKETIPRLDDVLKLVDGKVPLIVEFKVEWNAKSVCEKTNELLKNYKGIYCIESFSPLALYWYRKHNPYVMRGQLASDFLGEKKKGSKVQYFLLDNLLLNFIGKPDFIAYNYRYRKRLSFCLVTKLFGALSFAWTIKSQEALEQSREDFQYFIFDSFIPKE